MKKEEILEMSRRENKNKDIYEQEVDTKSVRLGATVMLILATIYYSYEIFTGKGQNPAFYSLITIFCATSYLYKSLKSKTNRKFSIVNFIIWTSLSTILILEYFKVL